MNKFGNLIPGKLYKLVLGSGTFIPNLNDVTLLRYDIKNNTYGRTFVLSHNIILYIGETRPQASGTTSNVFMSGNKQFRFYHSFIERSLILA